MNTENIVSIYLDTNTCTLVQVSYSLQNSSILYLISFLSSVIKLPVIIIIFPPVCLNFVSATVC